jgi:hypothetical protein
MLMSLCKFQGNKVPCRIPNSSPTDPSFLQELPVTYTAYDGISRYANMAEQESILYIPHPAPIIFHIILTHNTQNHSHRLNHLPPPSHSPCPHPNMQPLPRPRNHKRNGSVCLVRTHGYCGFCCIWCWGDWAGSEDWPMVR